LWGASEEIRKNKRLKSVALLKEGGGEFSRQEEKLAIEGIRGDESFSKGQGAEHLAKVKKWVPEREKHLGKDVNEKRAASVLGECVLLDGESDPLIQGKKKNNNHRMESRTTRGGGERAREKIIRTWEIRFRCSFELMQEPDKKRKLAR